MSSRSASETPPLRVGLLGCSDIARRKFLPALSASSQARLAAVGSSAPPRAATLLAATSAPLCSYQELLADASIDLVYLSLPNHLHEEWAIRALEHGKHVICEKPLGLSPDSVARMLTVAERRQRLLYENLMFLHHPQHALVGDILAAGRVGRLTGLDCVFCIPLPTAGNFRRDPRQGGGALFDLARYPLATALLFFTGELCDFNARGVSREGLNLELQAEVRSSTGETLRFLIAFDRPYASWYRLLGASGAIRVERAFTPPAELANRIEVTGAGTGETIFAPAADQFLLMLDHVCSLLRGGGDFRPSHERSRQLAHLVAALEGYCHVQA